MGSFKPQDKDFKPGMSRSSVGFNAVARPGSFGRYPRTVTPFSGKKVTPGESNAEGRMRGSTVEGQAGIHQNKMLGARISNIGQTALASTSMLSGLATGQTQQAQLFNPKDIKSRARQTGRPLGYGTVYKFF
jgi:hypothetical protein